MSEWMVEYLITIVFCIVFYRMNVELDKDIFEQYREIEREIR